MNDLSLRFEKRGMAWPGRELLEERNIWVAVQTTDDIDYLIDCAGEDHLMLGTDYGHNDTASELNALRKLRQSGGSMPRWWTKFSTTTPPGSTRCRPVPPLSGVAGASLR